jgi:hypothetical protein
VPWDNPVYYNAWFGFLKMVKDKYEANPLFRAPKRMAQLQKPHADERSAQRDESLVNSCDAIRS